MPIRVLMFGWEFPPFNSGGLGTACRGLTQALSDQNVEITFVLPQKVAVQADFMRLVFADLAGFTWPDFTASAYDLQKFLLPGIPVQMAQDLVSAVNQYATAAAKIAKKYQCDIIHAHDWLCFPAGVIASDVSGRPLISHVHATEIDRSGGTGVNPLVYAVEKYSLDRSDTVIAVSNFTKNLLTKHYQTPADKVTVVHNGVTAADYAPVLDDTNPLVTLKLAGYQIVLFLGRFSLQKGPDYFLKAASKVLAFAPKTVFLMVGAGDMESQLVDLAIKLGISDHVLFTGFLRGEAWTQVFSAADLFVMPSVSEPFGLVALESIALGTPAIISKQSGVSEALRNVLKVDFWDVEEMSNKIISVLNYSPLRKELKTNSSSEVRSISWAAAAAKTIGVYKQVLSQGA